MWIQLNAALTDQRRAEISLIGPIQAWKDSTIGISNNFSANFNFASRPSFIQELNEMSSICTPLSYAGLHVNIIINYNGLHVVKMLIDPNDNSHGECMTPLK